MREIPLKDIEQGVRSGSMQQQHPLKLLTPLSQQTFLKNAKNRKRAIAQMNTQLEAKLDRLTDTVSNQTASIERLDQTVSTLVTSIDEQSKNIDRMVTEGAAQRETVNNLIELVTTLVAQRAS